MHRLMLLAVLVATLAVGALDAALAQDATPAPDPAAVPLARTNVRFVLPFTGDGLNAALAVTAQERGTCAHESLASPGRPDAWNCIGETSNVIYDPCFESPFSTPDEPGALACVASPFSTDVVLLTPVAALSRDKDTPPSGPVGAPVAPADPSRPQPTGAKPLPGVPASAVSSGVPAAAPEALDRGEPLPWAFELVDGQQCTLATGATAVFAGMRLNYFCSSGGAILGDPDRSLPVWAVTFLAEGAAASDLEEVAVVWH